MAGLNSGIEPLARALLEQGFRAADEFDSFVTFERADGALKIHAGPNGSFAAFDGDDELVAEGDGPEELHRLLLTKSDAVA